MEGLSARIQGCDVEVLTDADALEGILGTVARLMGLTPVFARFVFQGLTLAMVSQELGIILRAERGGVWASCFTWGGADPHEAMHLLIVALQPKARASAGI